METSLVKNQYVISLRNGMIAYIIADSLEDIAGALQNNKFFNTREQMLVNTADIVAIMSPSEWEEQVKYQRGWYKSHRGTHWYNKKGEYQEDTEYGEKYNRADRRVDEILKSQNKDEAATFVGKLNTSEVRELLKERRPSALGQIEVLAGLQIK